MKFIISLLIIVYSSFAYSQTYTVGKSPTQISDLKKKATLKFEIYNQKNELINTFAGFFFGNEGRFVTVNHTFKEDFEFGTTKNRLLVIDGDENSYSEILMEGCSNSNNIDVCTGKILNFKPKAYFEASTGERNIGEIFGSVGHCLNDQKKSFNIKSGEIKKITNDYQNTYGAFGDLINLKTKLFEVSLPKCVGDSGGPIFDQYTGALIGMYSFYYKDHYFGIDVSEIQNVADKNKIQTLHKFTKENLYFNDNCAKLKKGSREYKNCIDLE